MLRFILPVAAMTLLAACGDPATETVEDRDAAADALIEKHLPWNDDAKGVETTEDGIKYIVLKAGKGESPTVEDRVKVHYEGRLPTGETFDSSYERGNPASFKLNQVIPGWTLGLQKMKEGSKYLFYIPNNLAYGQQDRGEFIKAGDDLIFLVELIDVVEPKTADAAAWEKYGSWNPDASEVVKTESGLQYVVLAEGEDGASSPVNGEMVVVHYEGRLAADGSKFDSSFDRGDPATFPSNQLIPGWVEALEMMKVGDRWMLYIPADLGYGTAGTPGGPIPPNADLMFEVEMVDVMKRN